MRKCAQARIPSRCRPHCIVTVLLSTLVLATVIPRHGHAQRTYADHGSPDEAWQAPVWAGEVAFLSANTLIGALTAGLFQELRGGSFRDGFARGAFGGAVAYAGRRVAVERFYGAGLLGRQFAALGTAAVRNASEGRPTFERLIFPLGPVHLSLDRSTQGGPRVRVSGYELFWLLRAAATPELEFDVSRSLSAGAPVFDAPRRWILTQGDTLNGRVVGGVIVLSGLQRRGREMTFAHERVHVLQDDFLQHIWSDPLERWALRRVPLGADVGRFVEPGVALVLIGAGLDLVLDVDVEYPSRPHEAEALFLGER